jgi:transposase
MASVGLISSEHSSGTTRTRGGITKTGNAPLRRGSSKLPGTIVITRLSARRCDDVKGGQAAAVCAQAWQAP